MTENANTQPDPNAGEPAPGATARKAESVTEAARTEAGQAAQAAQAETAQAGPASRSAASSATGSGSEPPVTQNPATGSIIENTWATPAEENPGFAEPTEPAGPADPNAPKTSVAATFLPGIDATSILALVVAALAAGAFLLVNPLVQAHDAARTWSDFKNNVPRTRQDPFGLQRDWVDYQSWAHIILGLVAVLLALTVLALWTAQRNNLRSRSFAQAALVLGLAVVLYGILLKTGAVGSEIPSMKEISTGLSSSAQ